MRPLFAAVLFLCATSTIASTSVHQVIDDFVAGEDALPKEFHDFIHELKEVIPDTLAPHDVVERLASVGLSAAPVIQDEHSFAILSPINTKPKSEDCLPIVQMHGMGDFADNPAYKRLGRAVSETLTGSADACHLLTPQLGMGPLADIMGSFLRPLEPSIDLFAEIVRNDSTVMAAGAFNAIGYSQGNLIIRGYIEKYNDPPVNHHMSMHGMGMGVAGFPGCPIKTYEVCQQLDYVLGELAYLTVVQDHLMQANYYRDPMHIEQYRAGDKGLAELNNEAVTDASQTVPTGSLTLSAMTGNLTLVKGLQDTTVEPNDSEWYAYLEDGSQTEIVNMTDAAWYTWFDLDKMDANGQLGFETTPGGHMQFTTTDLTDLVAKYWM